MKQVIYDFSGLGLGSERKYLFQLVENRRLTDVYHSHDFYELIAVTDGSGVKLVNESELAFEASTVLILRPGDRHCFLSQSKDVRVVSLSVRREEFELLATAFSHELLRGIRSGDEPPCFFADARLFSLLPLHGEDPCEYGSKFLLSCFLMAYADSADERSELPSMLAEAIEKMKSTENLRRGIEALEELSFYSRSHLSRLIKKHFGMSPKQYINEQRLDRAYKDIIFTGRSIEDISEELGFRSFSHFNKIFKARFSVTPVALRKKSGVRTV